MVKSKKSGIQFLSITATDFFEKHEYLGAFLFLIFLLTIFFFDIIFLNSTFSTVTMTSGTMPDGPYNYSGPELSYHFVYDPWAPALGFVPRIYFMAETVKSGELPLWNPYQGMGTPFIADFLSAFFYPLNIVAYGLPESMLPHFFDLCILVKLLVAGFFTYCFMRELSVGKTGSLVSSVIFMFNGYFVYYINMAHLNTEVLIPILFFTLEKLLQKQDLKTAVAGIFVVVLMISGGMPEAVLFAFSVGGLYFLYRVLSLNWNEFRVKKIIRPVLLLSCVMVAGLLISAPQVIPFIEFLRNSFSYHTQITGLNGYGFKNDTISLIIPIFFGITFETWSGVTGSTLMPFIGIIAASLAILSINKWDGKYPPVTFFFWGISVFYLLKFYAFPLVNWVGFLPFFDVCIFPKYLFPEFAFSIAVLAGIGFSTLSQKTLKWTIASLSVLGLVTVVFGAVNYPIAKQSSKIFEISGWEFSAVTWMILACAVGITFLSILTIVLALSKTNKLNKRYTSYIILFVLVAELFLYVPHIHPERVDPYNEPPYIAFLKNDSAIYRVVGLDSILFPNAAAPFKISDIRILEPMSVNRFRPFIDKLIDPKVSASRYTGEQLSISVDNSRFLDLCNVKYILSMKNQTFSQKSDSLVPLIAKQGLIFTEKAEYVIINPGGHDIFAHPSSEIVFNTTVPDKPIFLLFTYGLDEKTWAPGKGDGVTFRVQINDTFSDKIVFSDYINPSGNSGDRRWFSETVNLSGYPGKEVQIHLQTYPGPGKNNAYDWAHWKSISIVSASELEEWKRLENRYTLVYDNEIKIYRSRDVLPRAFVVDDYIVKNNESEIFRAMKDPAFNLSKTIILEKEIPELEKVTNLSVDGMELHYQVEIQKYSPNEVLINATLNKPGLLLLTDTFYPGWTVIVDGNPQEILPADYAFRAVYVGEGSHLIEFKYQPMSFILGLWISLLTLSGFGIVSLYLRRRARRYQEKTVKK